MHMNKSFTSLNSKFSLMIHIKIFLVIRQTLSIAHVSNDIYVKNHKWSNLIFLKLYHEHISPKASFLLCHVIFNYLCFLGYKNDMTSFYWTN